MEGKFFIIVPADTPDGPIKGAYALANEMSKCRDVTMVLISRGRGTEARLADKVNVIYLSDNENMFIKKLIFYRKLLSDAGGKNKVVSISMCFSADMMNIGCKSNAFICSSVRGNLFKNYSLDYGYMGNFLAVLHLLSLRLFDQVVAMTNSMSEQVSKFIYREPYVIGNFVDESSLGDRSESKGFIDTTIRFIFVGSLSIRKRPLILISAIARLVELGHEVRLDYLGDGPLREELANMISQKKLDEEINLCGFVDQPYSSISNSDVMVLPSLSEGMSRAILESLFLGVPCVAADVDGNSEVIIEGFNGALFSNDDELMDAMLRAAKLSQRNSAERTILTPEKFRQSQATRKYIDIMEKHFTNGKI